MSLPPAAEVVRWAVVVPVKRLDVAKSRLAVLGDDARRALALAFAEDVVTAALACALVDRVVVVTDDADAARALGAAGASVTPDRPDAGIDAALEHGAGVALADAPHLGVAAVAADLPALTGDALGRVLAALVGGTRGVVADAAGTGTTVLAAAPGLGLQPSYGDRSLARHLASGAVPLEAPAAVRRDVDTPADLADAVRLGTGPRTAEVLRRLDERDGPGAPPAQRGTMVP